MSLVDLPLTCLCTTSLRPSRDSSEHLINSVREKGVIEPIIVRPVDAGYEVVEGLRRFDAARKAGLNKIPAIIKKLSDQDVVSLFLLENLKNNTISPIELAETTASNSNYTEDKVKAATAITEITKTGQPPTILREFWKNPFRRMPTENIICKNCELRTRLKDPHKAFQLYMPQWSVQFKAVGDVLNQVKVESSADIQRRIVSLFHGLNSINGKAQQDYNAAYFVYHSNVCDDRTLTWWMKTTEEIMKKTGQLMLIETQLKIAASNQSSEALSKALDNVSEQIQQWLREGQQTTSYNFDNPS